MGNLRFRQVHLDFHTSEQIVGIGDKFDGADFARTLKQAGVDSITCFARCHHGMIYYDTKFEAKHPNMKINLLKEQIDACHAEDIRVPIYITVGWDEFTAAAHPEWLQRDKSGKVYGAGPLEAGWRKLCFNTDYVDYVEAQTMEVLEQFGNDVDGIFYDIISQPPCYCATCMEKMAAAGIDRSDEKAVEAYSKEVCNQLKRRLSAAIRSRMSDCPIFYNAGHIDRDIRPTLEQYSHLELESLPSGGWGYDHFPVTARYARLLGQETMGMTGRFHKSWADFGGYKTQEALEYECFMSLSLGSKCSIGDQLHPNGAINKATYQLIGSVYNQVKEKQAWCEDTTPVSEIAVLTTDGMMGASGSLQGLYHMMEEAHLQFDIVDELMDWSGYRLLILPDVCVLNETACAKTQAFLDKGGKLIASGVSGRDALGRVLPGLGIEDCGEAEYSPDYLVPGIELGVGLPQTEYVMYDRGRSVRGLVGTEILACGVNPYFQRNYEHFCSHFQTPPELGGEDGVRAVVTRNGDCVYFAHPVFASYHKHGYHVYRKLVANAVRMLMPGSLICTDAPSTAHMTLNYQKKDERYVLHVLHYIPERRNASIDVIQDVIPLYGVKVGVRLGKKPEKVYLAPEREEIAFEWKDERVEVCIPAVKGHAMVVFE